jgi:hypothetical protein
MLSCATSSSELVFRRLSAEARPGCVGSLNAIHQACRALVEKGDRVLRTRDIARVCEQLGGPSEKTINNDHAKLYQPMINAHREEQRANGPRHRRRRNRWSDVDSVYTRARIACLEIRIQDQNRMLRRAWTSHGRTPRRR